MNELEQNETIDKQKIRQAKVQMEREDGDLALEPDEYDIESMDIDEELAIMEASVPDFLHWSQMVSWTLDQGIALLLAKDPYQVYWARVRGYVHHYYSIPLCQDYANLRTTVVQARAINEITR